MKLPPLPPIRTVEVKLQDEVFAAIDGFAENQLRDYGIACAKAALEAAAEACEFTQKFIDGEGNVYAQLPAFYDAKMCAVAIRALEIET